jgi:hypothetical protein
MDPAAAQAAAGFFVSRLQPGLAAASSKMKTLISFPSLACLLLTLAGSLAADDEAGFTVKFLADNGFPRQLEVELVCSAGISESMGAELAPGQPARLVFADFHSAAASCDIRARLPRGYRAVYASEGDPENTSGPDGCRFTGVAPGHEAACVLQVTQEPVKIMVYKKWIGGSGRAIPVRIRLDCESGSYSGDRQIDEGAPDGWEIRDIDPDGVLCNVYEEENDSYRPDIIDCQGLFIVPGRGEECTMVNTRIVKRIEMLNRYGVVVMILLVLAVGLLAMKRLY